MAIIRAERPPFLTVYKEEGYWILDCEDGTILTREKWLELRAQVDTFYAKHSDADIDEHNAKWLCEQGVEPEPEPEPPAPGYIYVIHGEGTPWYKIGLSTKPNVRLRQLGARGPFVHRLLHCFAVEDMLGVEQTLHTFFAHKRAQGEWFKLNAEDVAMVRGLDCRTVDDLLTALTG